MKKDNIILDKTFKFSLIIINLYREIEYDSVGKILGRQLLRSGTSIGANIKEAQGASSKADFINKNYIALKEANETSYWLILIKEAKLKVNIDDIIDETNQIIKIITSIIITTKNVNNNS